MAAASVLSSALCIVLVGKTYIFFFPIWFIFLNHNHHEQAIESKNFVAKTFWIAGLPSSDIPFRLYCLWAHCIWIRRPTWIRAITLITFSGCNFNDHLLVFLSDSGPIIVYHCQQLTDWRKSNVTTLLEWMNRSLLIIWHTWLRERLRDFG